MIIEIILLLILLAGIFPLSIYIVRTLRTPGQPMTGPNTLDGAWIKEKEWKSPSLWWESQRGRFNRNVVFAVGISFALYSFLLWKYDFLLVTNLILMSIICIIYLGVINLFYNLGPISEMHYSPENLEKFRKRTFTSGMWLSMILPFLFPIWLFISN